MSGRLFGRALPAALLLAGCGHSNERSGDSAATTSSAVISTASSAPLPSPSAPASAVPSASASVPFPSDELDPNQNAAEPERKTLKSAADDPAIYKNRDFIADHYGVVQLPFPLQLQSLPLPHARRALLLTGEGPALEKTADPGDRSQ